MKNVRNALLLALALGSMTIISAMDPNGPAPMDIDGDVDDVDMDDVAGAPQVVDEDGDINMGVEVPAQAPLQPGALLDANGLPVDLNGNPVMPVLRRN